MKTTTNKEVKAKAPPKKRGPKPGTKRMPKKLNRSKLSLSGEWYQRLREEELGHDEKSGEEFVYFRGLARLAEEAGKVSEKIISSTLQPLLHSKNDEYYNLIVQVVVEVTFDDGTIWCGIADAHRGNCLKYSNHPSALAETRALARAYRRALGINVVALEETSPVAEGVMTGKPENSQLSLIRRLASKYEIKLIDVIKEVTKREEVTAIEHLNYDEAQEAARYLNEKVGLGVAKEERKNERKKTKEATKEESKG